MSNKIARIILLCVISILVIPISGLTKGPLDVFENEISKTNHFDSLGLLKERIHFSTDLDMIQGDQFIDEIKKNLNESFYIKADKKSLTIVGQTDKAVEHGIFYYLYHLGFRYYFPNKNWHFIPEINNIFKPLEGVFSPDYLNRRLSYGYRTGSELATKDFNFWRKANLMGSTIPGFSGHAYDQIVRRNQKIFLDHPEYFAQQVEKGNIPSNPKFDVSNPDLIDLVIEDALKLAEEYQKKYGQEFIISLDPSDGGGYCEKPACNKWKSEADQVYYLANEVAKKLKVHYPKAYVGLYAYNYHSTPPSFDLEDNLIIYIATAFNKSTLNYNQLLDEWRKKVEIIGIRDYFGVINWDWDLPGKGKGTKPLQIHKSLNNYFSENARLYYIESINGWITKGLGHYIAARTLWDIDIIPTMEIDEFYTLLFPKTEKIMRPLMEELMGYTREVPLDKDIQNWIEKIFIAYEQSASQHERNRIDDVMQYLYAMVLYIKRSKNNVQTYKDLFKFLNQTNDNSNFATYAMRRVLFSDFREIMPESIINTRTSAINYKSNVEIDYKRGLDSILNAIEPIHWIPYQFDKAQLRFNEIDISSTRSSNMAEQIRFRENHIFLIEVNYKSSFSIYEGIVDYQNKRGGLVELFSYEDENLVNPIHEIPLETGSITDISLNELSDGKYWMKITDNREGFRFTEKTNVRIAIFQDKNQPLNTIYRNAFYFHVPESVSQFVIRKEGSATIISPSGRLIDLEKYDRSNVKVEVEKDEIGYWKVEDQKGSFFVEGVPPFFASKKDDLPLFKEKSCFLLFWK